MWQWYVVAALVALWMVRLERRLSDLSWENHELRDRLDRLTKRLGVPDDDDVDDDFDDAWADPGSPTPATEPPKPPAARRDAMTQRDWLVVWLVFIVVAAVGALASLVGE